jgi:ligand-binding sensor domain-containing protein
MPSRALEGRLDGALLRCWLALLALTCQVVPAAASTALGDYFQETWSTADGLPHNQVLDIEQSADGYLWLATWEGAARFNGHEFELLDAARLPDATEPAATELALRADGTPLIGTARGELLRLGGGRWQRSAAAEGGRSLPIYSLLALGDQHLVGTAGSGLWQQQGEQPLGPMQDSAVPERGIVYALAADTDSDTLWVGTDRGLYRRRDGVWGAPDQTRGLPDKGVLSLAVAADRSLVVGTVAGAYRVEDGRATPLHADLPVDSFESLLVDRRGDIWLGSANRGLFRVGERGVERLSADQGLPSNRVVALFEDREGSLWVGTSRGLFRLREAPFLSITQRQGLTDVYTRTLLELPDGRVLAGTSGGIALIARSAEGDRVVSRALPEESVLSAVRASDGSLWIGTYYNGLLQYAGERVQRRLSVDDGLPSVQVRALLAEPDGRLQIGTSRGLARWDGQRIEVFSAADGLPSESIISLHRDQGGQLWVGTGAGIALQRGARFELIDPLLLDGALRIYGITEDAQRRIFIAHDRGLSMREEGRWHSLGARQGLPIGSVFALRFDAAGNFWLSANRGVLRIDHDAALEALRGAVQ